jgi:hypothetical protein
MNTKERQKKKKKKKKLFSFLVKEEFNDAFQRFPMLIKMTFFWMLFVVF